LLSEKVEEFVSANFQALNVIVSFYTDKQSMQEIVLLLSHGFP